MAEITVPSGAKVVIQPAGFMDAINLKAAIGKEMGATDFKLDLDVQRIEDFDASEILKVVMAVDASKAVFDALFKCLARCTYDGVKITDATFEDVKAREDYYAIAYACVEANIGPFIKGLLSKLLPLAGQFQAKLAASVQKPK